MTINDHAQPLRHDAPRPERRRGPLRPRTGLAGWVLRHPLGAFYLWFFTVGQAVAFTPVVARSGFDVELSSAPFLIAATPVGLVLPVLVITWLAEGADGVRALRRRVLAFRAPPRWYGAALVGVPAVALAAVVAKSGLPVDGSGLAAALGLGYVLQLILVFLTVNWWEETAWTGFVQAHLQERHGPSMAAVLTGVPFALGHVSLVVEDSVSEALAFLVLLIIVSIPFRALQGWVYNRTGSLVVVGLVHAAANAVGVGSAFGTGLLDRLYPGAGEGGITIPLLAVVGVVVMLATRGRLGARRRPARRHARRIVAGAKKASVGGQGAGAAVAGRPARGDAQPALTTAGE